MYILHNKTLKRGEIHMKLSKIVIAAAIGVTMLGGASVEASNLNISDTNWSYTNNTEPGYTSLRSKKGSGNVYCYPITGGSVYVTVQKITSSSYADVSKKRITLNKGKKYTIVNSAGSPSNVRLKFNATSSSTIQNTGKWSPDATTDYTVVGK
jgi:hypothetical protein